MFRHNPLARSRKMGLILSVIFCGMLTESLSVNRESAGANRPALIYVVDDEALIAEIVEAILNLEGFEVRCFHDPVDAWKSFSESPQKPDMLVTDYVMHPWNGMELIQKFRSVLPNLPSILYSGNTNAQITDLYAMKPNAFLPKPFLPETLVRLVRSVLDRQS